MTDIDTTQIANAPHWMNSSVVMVKTDFTAKDNAWISAQLLSVSTNGVGSTATPTMEYTGKDASVLKVQRMVQPGSVVQVKRPGGRVKTVHLPQEAEELLLPDLGYIVAQIDLLNMPMSPEEQSNFLASANGHSEMSLQTVS